MPFYTFKAEDGEKIEKLFTISERPDEIEVDGKLYKRELEFGTTFHLKGNGWTSKGGGHVSSPKKGKEVGIAVDHDKKREMKENGEI